MDQKITEADGNTTNQRFKILYCSDSDPNYPPVNLLSENPFGAGWVSAPIEPGNEEVHEIIFCFIDGICILKSIQLIANEIYTPKQVEIFVSTEPNETNLMHNDDVWITLGVLPFQNKKENQPISERGRQRKTVRNLNIRASSIKLAFKDPILDDVLANININYQVGISAVACEGISLGQQQAKPLSRLVRRPGSINGTIEQDVDQNNISENERPSSKVIITNTGKQYNQEQNYESDSASNLDYNRPHTSRDVRNTVSVLGKKAPELSLYVEKSMEKQRLLVELKTKAVAAEDFLEADRIKITLISLRKLVESLSRLEVKKLQTIRTENYKMAHAIKVNIIDIQKIIDLPIKKLIRKLNNEEDISDPEEENQNENETNPMYNKNNNVTVTDNVTNSERNISAGNNENKENTVNSNEQSNNIHNSSNNIIQSGQNPQTQSLDDIIKINSQEEEKLFAFGSQQNNKIKDMDSRTPHGVANTDIYKLDDDDNPWKSDNISKKSAMLKKKKKREMAMQKLQEQKQKMQQNQQSQYQQFGFSVIGNENDLSYSLPQNCGPVTSMTNNQQNNISSNNEQPNQYNKPQNNIQQQQQQILYNFEKEQDIMIDKWIKTMSQEGIKEESLDVKNKTQAIINLSQLPIIKENTVKLCASKVPSHVTKVIQLFSNGLMFEHKASNMEQIINASILAVRVILEGVNESLLFTVQDLIIKIYAAILTYRVIANIPGAISPRGMVYVRYYASKLAEENQNIAATAINPSKSSIYKAIGTYTKTNMATVLDPVSLPYYTYGTLALVPTGQPDDIQEGYKYSKHIAELANSNSITEYIEPTNDNFIPQLIQPLISRLATSQKKHRTVTLSIIMSLVSQPKFPMYIIPHYIASQTDVQKAKNQKVLECRIQALWSMFANDIIKFFPLTIPKNKLQDILTAIETITKWSINYTSKADVRRPLQELFNIMYIYGQNILVKNKQGKESTEKNAVEIAKEIIFSVMNTANLLTTTAKDNDDKTGKIAILKTFNKMAHTSDAALFALNESQFDYDEIHGILVPTSTSVIKEMILNNKSQNTNINYTEQPIHLVNNNNNNNENIIDFNNNANQNTQNAQEDEFPPSMCHFCLWTVPKDIPEQLIPRFMLEHLMVRCPCCCCCPYCEDVLEIPMLPEHIALNCPNAVEHDGDGNEYRMFSLCSKCLQLIETPKLAEHEAACEIIIEEDQSICPLCKAYMVGEEQLTHYSENGCCSKNPRTEEKFLQVVHSQVHKSKKPKNQNDNGSNGDS